MGAVMKYRCVHFDGQNWVEGRLTDRNNAVLLVLFKQYQNINARLENENGTEEKV